VLIFHDGRSARPAGSWTRKQAEDALREWLTDLGRTPDGPAPAERVVLSLWRHFAVIRSSLALKPPTRDADTRGEAGLIAQHYCGYPL
jgi:hypothetical protein